MSGKRIASKDPRADNLDNRPRTSVLEKDPKKSRGSLAEGQKTKKKRRPEGAKKARRRILIVLVIVLAVLLGLLVVWKGLVHQPLLPGDGSQTESLGNQPKMGGERKKDFYTFLVVGRDDGGGGNTDTLMLVAYDVANQKVNVMSIYRDTLVNVPWEIKRINSVYNVMGIDGLLQNVGKLTGFIPDYYFIMELDAVSQLVDAIGGVDFDVPCNMSYDDPTQNLHIHFSKGMQHLNGDQAKVLLRWRKNNSGATKASIGDIGRVEIQHKFLTALAEQTLKAGNVTKMKEITKIIKKNLDSNLSSGEMLWFGQKLLEVDPNNIQFRDMPANTGVSIWSKTYRNYQSYVEVNEPEMLNMVNQYFNPYSDDITPDRQDIFTASAAREAKGSTKPQQVPEQETQKSSADNIGADDIGSKPKTDSGKTSSTKGKTDSGTTGKTSGESGQKETGEAKGETDSGGAGGTTPETPGGNSENTSGDGVTGDDTSGSGAASGGSSDSGSAGSGGEQGGAENPQTPSGTEGSQQPSESQPQ